MKAVREFPFLKEYEDLWVVKDFLKTRLKYTSEQLRKVQNMPKKLTRVRGSSLTPVDLIDSDSRLSPRQGRD
jgi:hypothetical protein